MITLDQVYLLEQKVESAVEKIQQLQAENDALRKKCVELTNALSSKSEQLNSFASDQSQIEDGIKKALDRLSLIENSVLKAVGQGQPVPPVQPKPQPVVTNTVVTQPIIENTSEEDSYTTIEETVPSFDTMETISTSDDEASESEKELEETLNWDENSVEINDEENPAFTFDEIPEQMDESSINTDDDSSDELGFDIF